jgi:hypothetical protein
VGTWKLDVTQSDFGSGPAPKSSSLVILTDTPQKYSYRAHGVDENGKPFEVSWSGPPDGSMHPVMLNGKPSGQTSGFKREPDGTMVRHGERPDGSTVEVHISMSPDGNTLTDEFTSKSKDGKESREKQVWHRVGVNGKPAS